MDENMNPKVGDCVQINGAHPRFNGSVGMIDRIHDDERRGERAVVRLADGYLVMCKLAKLKLMAKSTCSEGEFE